MDGDVTRYCRTCDACKRMVKEGVESREPLVKVSLIATFFKRVAIDIVDPINPPMCNGLLWRFNATIKTCHRHLSGEQSGSGIDTSTGTCRSCYGIVGHQHHTSAH
ncbi:Zinc finger protein [Plakobranchus ocellatus]|uniref:Zinc finger protein n=1 Tax=Plakobranchus ocellatus TaxID=259542 RepID=A0AAV4BZT2_9GAST|nr:Zinc finger protein [Plakobranchus ocellatus]